MEAQASGMMGKIDGIIWSLDPGSDTLPATISFIQRHAEDLARANGLRFRAGVHGLDGEPPIGTTARRDLYLVAKEALRNVVQHAQAHAVQLTVACTPQEIHLAIEDDGPGMPDNGRTGNGHGLENMRRRVQRMGGTIRFDRSELGGARVDIRIPLDPNSHL
jgi:signal transduction histidine kinase